MLPCAALILLGPSLAAGPSLPPREGAAPDARAPEARAPVDSIPTLSVRDLSGPRQGSVVATARAEELAGARVRLVGFMARMEESRPGEFWLTSRPVECDEGGGGTADLPPGSVRVLIAEAPGPIEGPIAVIGVLEVGNRPGDAAGEPASTFRLRVERPALPSPPRP